MVKPPVGETRLEYNKRKQSKKLAKGAIYVISGRGPYVVPNPNSTTRAAQARTSTRPREGPKLTTSFASYRQFSFLATRNFVFLLQDWKISFS